MSDRSQRKPEIFEPHFWDQMPMRERLAWIGLVTLAIVMTIFSVWYDG